MAESRNDASSTIARRARRIFPYIVATMAAPIAVLAASAYVTAQSDFGRGDLSSFAFWTAIFVVPLLCTFGVFEPALARLGRGLRVLAGLLLGASAGFLFTVALATGMGPSIAAFSFPILYIWAVSAALSCALAAVLIRPAASPPTAWRTFIKGGVALLAFGAVAGLPMALLYGSIHVWGRAQHEVYVLPMDFEGPVLVVFNQPDATPLPIVDGTRELAVPASGVLVTSSSMADGWKKPDVFYQRQDGSRLPLRTDWADIDTSLDSRRAVWASIRASSLRYEAFIVGPRDQDAAFTHQARVLLDSVSLRIFTR